MWLMAPADIAGTSILVEPTQPPHLVMDRGYLLPFSWVFPHHLPVQTQEGRAVGKDHTPPSPLGWDGACYQCSAASIPRITSYSHCAGIIFCPGDVKQLSYDKVNNLPSTTKCFSSRAGKEPRTSLPSRGTNSTKVVCL